MKNNLLIAIAFLAISQFLQAQTSGEGVACITGQPSGARFSCDSGLTCASDSGAITGTCLNLSSDSFNCGAVNMRCSGGDICQAGSCMPANMGCDPTGDQCYGGMPPLAALHPFRLKPVKIALPVT